MVPLQHGTTLSQQFAQCVVDARRSKHMPSKSQDHLHRLVRSMTGAEKRNFKLFTRRVAPDGETNQHLLFDAISSMDAYDEEALLRRFRHEAFTNHFPITKRRLYETVLKSLASFHADSSVDVRLHRLLQQVEILHQRALYDDAWKVLQSVRKSAEKHERHPALLAVTEWERRLIECRNYSGMDARELDVRSDRDKSLQESIAQVSALWSLKSKLLMELYQHGQARDKEGLAAIDHLLEHTALQVPNDLLSARAQFLYHHVHGAAAFGMGDTAKCHQHLSQNLSLLNGKRDRFQHEPNLVLGVMSNLIYVCIQRGHYEEAFAHLREFRVLPALWKMPESEDLDLKLFSTSMSLELSMHLRTGNVAEALELVHVVERGLARHAGLISPVRAAGFNYQLAYTLFMAGRPDKALARIHTLLNQARVDNSSEAVCFGRLLQLLLLLETGKTDVLRFTLRNTERFLRLRARKQRFEPLFLQLVRALSRKGNAEEQHALITAFRDRMLELEYHPFERTVFDHLDPIAWAESKLTGEPYATRIKRRLQAVERAA